MDVFCCCCLRQDVICKSVASKQLAHIFLAHIIIRIAFVIKCFAINNQYNELNEWKQHQYVRLLYVCAVAFEKKDRKQREKKAKLGGKLSSIARHTCNSKNKLNKDSYSVHTGSHLNCNQICETVLHVKDIRKRSNKKKNTSNRLSNTQ